MKMIIGKYTLSIGKVGSKRFYSLFDEKMNQAIYQIVLNGNSLEEVYPLFNKSSEKKLNVIKNRFIGENIKKKIINIALRDLKTKKIFLVGCSAKKNKGFHTASNLYDSTRITFAKNQSTINNSNLFILSAKYGLVEDKTLIENYDMIMSPKQQEKILNTVVSQLKLSNIKEVLFFKAGVNKNYLELMEKACKIQKVKLVAIGTSCMGGAKEIKELLAS